MEQAQKDELLAIRSEAVKMIEGIDRLIARETRGTLPSSAVVLPSGP